MIEIQQSLRKQPLFNLFHLVSALSTFFPDLSKATRSLSTGNQILYQPYSNIINAFDKQFPRPIPHSKNKSTRRPFSAVWTGALLTEEKWSYNVDHFFLDKGNTKSDSDSMLTYLRSCKNQSADFYSESEVH